MNINLRYLRPFLGWSVVLGIMTVPVFTVTGAVEIFLKVTGIPIGESVDKTFPGNKGWSDIISWSWGASNSGTTHTGGGGGVGKAAVKDLSLTKNVDSTSPALLLAALKGTVFSEVNLVVRKSAATSLPPFIKLNMKEVIVTNISTGGSKNDVNLTESVSLNFARFEFIYTPVNSTTGVAGAEIPTRWNIVENTNSY